MSKLLNKQIKPLNKYSETLTPEPVAGSWLGNRNCWRVVDRNNQTSFIIKYSALIKGRRGTYKPGFQRFRSTGKQRGGDKRTWLFYVFLAQGEHAQNRMWLAEVPHHLPLFLNKIEPNPIKQYTVETDTKYKITSNKQY